MQQLRARRGYIKASVSRLETFLDSLSTDNDVTIENLLIRSEKLEENYKSFQSVQDDLINACSEPEEYVDDVDVLEFERKYFKCREKLLRLINKLNRDINVPTPTYERMPDEFKRLAEEQTSILKRFSINEQNKTGFGCEPQLPKLTIKQFSGDLTEWYSFQDLFKGSVHDNSRLTGSQKFHYLKSFLCDDALNLLKHLPISDSNYEEAWNKLKERYDKKGSIAKAFVKRFMSMPTLANNVTSTSLRKLSDTADEVIRGLRALGAEAETRDLWIIHILSNKLDDSMRKHWAEENEDEFPSLDKFLKFLNHRSEILENCQPAKSGTSKEVPPKPKFRNFHLSSSVKCPRCEDGHTLSSCPQFARLDVNSRRSFVNQKSLCFNCLRTGHLSSHCKSNYRCRICQQKHHTLVHLQSPTSTSQSQSSASTSQSQLSAPTSQSQLSAPLSQSQLSVSSTQSQTSFAATNEASFNVNQNVEPAGTSSTLSHYSSSSKRKTLTTVLPTAIVLVRNAKGIRIPCRVMLDSGSQRSFISESCVQQLGLKRKYAKISITGLSSTEVGSSKGVVSLELESRINSSKVRISAYILTKITSTLPSFVVDTSDIPTLSELPLADPKFYSPGSIDILLGSDKLFDVLKSEIVNVNPGKLSALLTIFGWVVGGEMTISDQSAKIRANLIERSATCNHSSEEDLGFDLRRFWELEERLYMPSLTNEEQRAETHFASTHKRTSNGRYIVNLPFKDSLPTNFGNSLERATNQLIGLEIRLSRNPILKKLYIEFMEEYLAMGHMQEIPDKEINKPSDQCYYLPHHAVLKEDSSTTKLRVVFNGSASVSNCPSLNDTLLPGPSLQQDIFSILVRFRVHQYAFTADLEKMFRQILVSENDQDIQRIVWRNNPDTPIQHYRLRTVTYGTASAPFLAIRVLRQLASDHRAEHPEAAQVIDDDFYMDDMVSGSDSIEHAVRLSKELISLLAKGGFKLRKWSSNCWPLLQSIPQEYLSQSPLEFDSTVFKILGIIWTPSDDNLSYKVTFPKECEVISKRTILSNRSKIFDPLGLIAPSIVMVKVLFQELWLHKLGWDDEVPSQYLTRWKTIRSELPILNSINIPRKLSISHKIEFHGFADASEKAYAAVLYCRSKDDNGYVINLVAAKTRVSPLKCVSIAKLELCAALLLCRLIEKLKTLLQISVRNLTAWSDSEIVLSWLSVQPRTLKTFQANRTSEILESLPREIWKHVSGRENPADCASRGMLPSQLINHDIWWHGPKWLSIDDHLWPNFKTPDITNEVRNQIAEGVKIDKTLVKPSTKYLSLTASAHQDIFDILLSRISSWRKLLHIIALCFRFIRNLRHRDASTSGNLRLNDINRAKFLYIGYAQKSAFEMEHSCLTARKQIPAKSKLIRLNPFIDDNSLLRVGGRLQQSSLMFPSKHPLILPKSHRVTRLIVEGAHQTYLHAGVGEMFVVLRQQYWILGCRNLIKNVVFNCLQCSRQRRFREEQIMGQLPASRITYARPFSRVGCDYAGPIITRLARGRNPKYRKGYIALFVCMTTKALHLELVSDLTTDAFLAALKRLVARRGKPAEIFSDNGTNFRGAARKLSEMHAIILSTHHNQLVAAALADDGICWRFIPPSSPHFGGIWEAGVRSVKSHLKRVIGNQILTYEELYTLLVQIEALLNSRPLFAISDTDTEFEALTPAHFLIGHSYAAVPEPDVMQNVNLLSNWKLLVQLQQGFWKAWHKSYLTSLQNRPKWQQTRRNVEEGDIVLLKEDNLPPSKWVLGRVMQCHPGPDGKTRVVTIRTSHGEIQRPVVKLAILPKTDRAESVRRAENV